MDYHYHYVDYIPTKCPHCGKQVTLKLLIVIPEKNIYTLDYKKETKYFSFIFQCGESCCKIIVAIYKEIDGYSHKYTYSSYYPKDEFLSPEFSDTINKLSPNFIEIYKQSAIAEHYQCKDIAGAGYRKALEFIVKDYAIKYNNETESAKIRTMPLSQVIETYLKSSKLKDIAKRATWLGNDEVHYEKKWKNENLETLKKAITISIRDIENEVETTDIINRMPE
jgi:hypothetical protein